MRIVARPIGEPFEFFRDPRNLDSCAPMNRLAVQARQHGSRRSGRVCDAAEAARLNRVPAIVARSLKQIFDYRESVLARMLVSQ